MPWTDEKPLPHPRAGLAAATFDAAAPESGYRIYAIGGLDASLTVVATTEAYDTAQKTWSAIPSMPTARYYLGAALSPGRLHALGGWPPAGGAPLTVHEIYEPANNGWSSQVAPLPSARAGLAAVTGPDGLIYAIGGYDGNNVVATVEAYDPATDAWTTKAPMLTPRAGLAAVTGPDRLIYAIGGADGQAALNSVEVFNTATNTWTPSAFPLPAATWDLAAAVGPNGLIYVIGGADANWELTATVYSYDPTAPGWANRPPLTSGRAGPAAATGPDGLIYAIGGGSSLFGVLGDDVEAYTYDKCDYLEYQIDVASNEIDDLLNLLEDPDLPPKARSAIVKQIATLRVKLKRLLAQLKKCRQQ